MHAKRCISMKVIKRFETVNHSISKCSWQHKYNSSVFSWKITSQSTKDKLSHSHYISVHWALLSVTSVLNNLKLYIPIPGFMNTSKNPFTGFTKRCIFIKPFFVYYSTVFYTALGTNLQCDYSFWHQHYAHFIVSQPLLKATSFKAMKKITEKWFYLWRKVFECTHNFPTR